MNPGDGVQTILMPGSGFRGKAGTPATPGGSLYYLASLCMPAMAASLRLLPWKRCTSSLGGSSSVTCTHTHTPRSVRDAMLSEWTMA
jgi:hypothetical protein